MTRAPQSGSGMWSCYGTLDEETGMYIAHCLDLHMKVSGKTPEQSWERLKRCLKVYYEYCYSCDPDALKLTASASEWAEYGTLLEHTLREDPSRITVETIELVLRPPKLPEQTMPLAFQKVEFAAQAASVH